MARQRLRAESVYKLWKALHPSIISEKQLFFSGSAGPAGRKAKLQFANRLHSFKISYQPRSLTRVNWQFPWLPVCLTYQLTVYQLNWLSVSPNVNISVLSCISIALDWPPIASKCTMLQYEQKIQCLVEVSAPTLFLPLDAIVNVQKLLCWFT